MWDLLMRRGRLWDGDLGPSAAGPRASLAPQDCQEELPRDGGDDHTTSTASPTPRHVGSATSPSTSSRASAQARQKTFENVFLIRSEAPSSNCAFSHSKNNPTAHPPAQPL